VQKDPQERNVQENKQEDTMSHEIEENVQQVIEYAQQEVTRSREPWYRVSKRARLLIGIYAIGFVLFILLAWFVYVHPVLPVDIAITREFQENKSPWLSSLMIAVSYLGSHFIIFAILILLTASAFWIVRLRLEAVLIVALSAINAPLNLLIKLIVSRPRPTSKFVAILQGANGASFPSGHVMAYVAFFGLLFSLSLILFKWRRVWCYVLILISALFVVLVGPSRIYLGDHWASDVLGGYLFGSLLLGISLWIYLKLKERGVLVLKVKPKGENGMMA
jgi:undecaprenyl-diphosphatase